MISSEAEILRWRILRQDVYADADCTLSDEDVELED
jgi:hypothetical protein